MPLLRFPIIPHYLSAEPTYQAGRAFVSAWSSAPRRRRLKWRLSATAAGTLSSVDGPGVGIYSWVSCKRSQASGRMSSILSPEQEARPHRNRWTELRKI
jgi:hypothetical protein